MNKHPWIKRIRKGDVLRAKSGRLRVVRAVQHSGPSIPKTCVTFTIQHCSWTGRCYTVYNGNDLRQMGFRPTMAHVKLGNEVDRAIEAEFNRTYARDALVKCCDVEEIA